jgi:hypothetical protein
MPAPSSFPAPPGARPARARTSPAPARRWRGAASASLAAALTAACADGAAPPTASTARAVPRTAPRAASSPIGPRPAPDILVTVRVVDATSGGMVTDGVQVSVRPYGAPPRLVDDDGAGDLDGRPGHLRLSVPVAMFYVACVAATSGIHLPDPAACVTRSGGGPTLDLGEIGLHRRPVLVFNMRGLDGAFAPGGAVHVTGPNGYDAAVADGSAADRNPGNNGAIGFRLPAPGAYAWCETVRPTGRSFTSPRCGTVHAQVDMQHLPMLFHAAAISSDPWWD